MPRNYDPHYEDEQDWEPIVLKKTSHQSNKDPQQDTIPIHRKIYSARKQYGITAHELAQRLQMRIKDYEAIENGNVEPTPNCIAKLRRMINLKT